MTRPFRIAGIVEGDGEVDAFPVLVRRVALIVAPAVGIDVPRPDRYPKQRLLKPGELERAVDLAARSIEGHGAILILLDADDDCPAQQGPAVLARATAARRDVAIGVALAKYEYEAWFLAAAESLAGRRSLPTDLRSPSDPEGIRGAKEWLGHHMPRNRRYSETLDQPALTALFDLQAARRANSFDKCYREIVRLMALAGSES